MAIADEGQLVRSSQKGDLDAFNTLVQAYQRQVYNLCLRMLGAAAAEDAAQETFIAAYRRLSGFRGGNFRAWLLRIAANICCDELRRQRSRPAASLAAALEAGSPADVPSDSAGPEEEALRRELGRHLQQGLATLPAEQRLVIILRDVHGLSYEELTEAMGCSLGTVKSRIARGRARMRDYLMARRELLARQFRHKE
ncbi:MAG: sigma-70 family RNA polymerase sigma factor [Dehalococcoidia bacterium]|nr:MAG: sigma-70 family RNA polymerase sigma factor [Dehalococcoidia bacterium]